MVRKRKKAANKKTNGKKDVKKLTVQQTIAYKEMGRDGICRVQGNVYSKCIRFYDINYQLAQNEDKNAIFENWCDFLNYFDSSIHFQLSFINHKSGMKEFEQVIKISPSTYNSSLRSGRLNSSRIIFPVDSSCWKMR